MATIKAYTTIEQSRKLAQILPLESADMCYTLLYTCASLITGQSKYNDFPCVLPSFAHGSSAIPCWSVGALLNVLPDHFYDKTGRKTLGMDKGDTYYNIFYENKYSYIQKSADNPVDACYAMILNLNELNLL